MKKTLLMALAIGMAAAAFGQQNLAKKSADHTSTAAVKDRYASITSATWSACLSSIVDGKGAPVPREKIFDAIMDAAYRKCTGMDAIDKAMDQAK